ncbi:aldo/keto reductase [Ktedonospora formicarum]|uniref:Aldo/keto reductase n=1 Tax=Ktedonospora formicarum TaxID=2778364 RepID=A0A8J3IBZ6_9CHLR|nr:aldo/keto reductase [Ktedonospora formicarum]GHO51196.1 aldo/keto reductase [Ktedonospora formicarum]
MRQVPLGQTGVQVSALCFGCMHIGTRIPEDTSYQLLDQYFEAGGRFLDTANAYAFWVEGCHGGESEALLGRWMSTRQNRSEIFLATKVGARPTVPGADLERAEGLSRQAIEQAVHTSLRRLGTDYIDLCYAHIDFRWNPLEETLEAFDDLVKAGKIRYLGCSNFTTWRIEQARQMSKIHGWTSFCCAQQRYTYLRPRHGINHQYWPPASEELLDYCREHSDFSLLAYSPLLEGAYTGKKPLPEPYQGPDTDARLRTLQAVAQEVGTTTNQLVLAWLLQSSPIVLPLIGASNPDQLRENLGSLQIHLDLEQMSRLTLAAGR